MLTVFLPDVKIVILGNKDERAVVHEMLNVAFSDGNLELS